jgi:hypothetical protein
MLLRTTNRLTSDYHSDSPFYIEAACVISIDITFILLDHLFFTLSKQLPEFLTYLTV